MTKGPLRNLAHAEIRGGHALLMSCVGEHACNGWLRIPFQPGIDGAPDGAPLQNGMVWKRVSGTTLDDLTLSPSIDAAECGHFHVENGRIV